MRVRSLLMALALAAASLQACGVPLPTDAPDAPGVPPILQGYWNQIQMAPSNIRYQGERRVTFSVNLPNGEPIQTKYIERVSSDGAGRFNILPLYAETPVTPDEATFLMLQERREGFFFRYRDFRVRDLEAFLENYRRVGYIKTVLVAGRMAKEFTFVRNIPGGRHYVVAFDEQTGLVLRYDEFDESGARTAALEYTSLDMDPDLSGVAYFVPGNNERSIDLATEDPKSLLGFKPRLPDTLPLGFSLIETAIVTDDAGDEWFKAGYSDGVEMLFFLHRDQSQMIFKLPVTGTPRTKQAPRDEVTVFRAGTVIAAQGTVAEQEMIAVGEVPESDLLMMIHSAR